MHQQKIQYVQKKLLLGETITTIAQELNYSSAYHLSKAFKQIVGISPREYKNKMNTL
ncbi:MAG: AraC family transcriptional regulator [Coprobacillus sp.]